MHHSSSIIHHLSPFLPSVRSQPIPFSKYWRRTAFPRFCHSTILSPLCGSHFCNKFIVVKKITPDVACNVSTSATLNSQFSTFPPSPSLPSPQRSTQAQIFTAIHHASFIIHHLSPFLPSVRSQPISFFNHWTRTAFPRFGHSTILSPLCGSHFCNKFIVVKKITPDVACNVYTSATLSSQLFPRLPVPKSPVFNLLNAQLRRKSLPLSIMHHSSSIISHHSSLPSDPNQFHFPTFERGRLFPGLVILPYYRRYAARNSAINSL